MRIFFNDTLCSQVNFVFFFILRILPERNPAPLTNTALSRLTLYCILLLRLASNCVLILFLRVSAFCAYFSLLFYLVRSFLFAGFVWKHLQNEFISLPLHRTNVRTNVRHKSINMKAFENEEHRCWNFRFKLY